MKNLKLKIFLAAWFFYDWTQLQKHRVIILQHQFFQFFLGLRPLYVFTIENETWEYIKNPAMSLKISRCHFIVKCIENGLELYKYLRDPEAKLILVEKDSSGNVTERQIVFP